VTDGAVEHQIAVKGYSAGARRWVPGTGKVILTGKAPRATTRSSCSTPTPARHSS
jgi:hypothetical protein